MCPPFAGVSGPAKKSEERWGTPIHVQLAIIRQESTFKFNARPPRKKLVGFIPWNRPKPLKRMVARGGVQLRTRGFSEH